jgi:segregation and condensation protein B
MNETRRILEAVLFVADEPVPTSDLALLVERPAEEIETLMEDIALDLEGRGSGIVVRKVAGGWRASSHPEAAPYLERFVTEHRSPRLTQAALETLAIVAYRQPISRIQIAEIRGVSSEGVLKTLISRGLVEEVGRDPGPGLAILYGTSTALLEKLGLGSLQDLPPLPDFMPGLEAVEKMETGLGPGV